MKTFAHICGVLWIASILIVGCPQNDSAPQTQPPPTPQATVTATAPETPTPIPTPELVIDPVYPLKTPSPSPEADARALGQAHEAFGLRLMQALVEATPGENVFISPASVALALSMALNGAEGATRDAMLDAMALQDLTLDRVNRASAELIQRLTADDTDCELAIANSLWGRQDASFSASFLETVRGAFGAEVQSLDFTQPSAIERINEWCAEQTRNKIPTILNRIDPSEVLFLINAVYFKGQWRDRFDPALTSDRPFHPSGNAADVVVPTMRRSGRMKYLEGDGFQAVELPYGDSGIGMWVVLPTEGAPLDEFVASLDAEAWRQWAQRMRPREGTLEMPRFTLTYEQTLNDALAVLGMTEAFNERARFDAMFDPPRAAAISRVVHKTFVDVNEEGTEAAAVTSVGIATTSIAQPESPFHMKVDHPFVCAIRDNATGELLFIGCIHDPS